jgi:hypothetical protein
MLHADRDSLRQIPYLNVDAIEDRTVKLMPLWDGERWRDWFPIDGGKIISVPIVDTLEGDYIALRPAKETDITIPFVELMWQRASWPDVCPFISGLCADFHNLGTSVEKTDYFFRRREELGHSIASFIKTELEYLFMRSRSIFDLLHDAIATIWETKIQLLDAESEAKRKRHKLPDRLSKMILNGDAIKPGEELVEKYALPPALAAAYEAVAPFFLETRRFRDAVVHRGRDETQIYSKDKGFCVPKEFRQIYDVDVQAPDHFHNENLVSLLPLIAHLVIGTIGSCNTVARAFAQQIKLPDEIAPGYRVFIRGPHNQALAWMNAVRAGGSPWWSDRSRSMLA